MEPSVVNSQQQPLLRRAHTMPEIDPLRRRMTPLLLRRETFPEIAAILSNKSINVFLIFVPVAIISGVLGLGAEAVFFLNFLALASLAPVLTMSVLKLSADADPFWGGLLKSVLGNTVELIVCMSMPALRFIPPFTDTI